MHVLRFALAGSLIGAGLHAGAVQVASQGRAAPPAVRAFGSLRAIMHDGHTGPVATLREWTPSPGLVAVGALSELRGEITAVAGRVYVSQPGEEGGAQTVELDSSDAAAALLVLAEVPRWFELPITSSITFERLDEALRVLADQAGLDVTRPFPFVVEGQVRDLQWHVVDGRRLAPGGDHEAHRRAGIRMERDSTTAVLVGFYSDAHQGVFTHHDSRTHAHVVVREPLASGHVDRVTIPAGAKLRLPAAK